MTPESKAIWKAQSRLNYAKKIHDRNVAEIREKLLQLIDREIRFTRGAGRGILSAGIINDVGCHSGHPLFSVRLIKKDGKPGGLLTVWPHQITEFLPYLKPINQQPTE